MSARSDERDDGCSENAGLGDFLRSLLRGIPWSERAEHRETVHFAAPPAALLRIDNSKGRTRIVGQDRSDIEVEVHKIARAESEKAASQLAVSTRLGSSEVDGVLELEIDLPRRWNRRATVNLEVRVPQRLAVEVNASNGKVEVKALRADCSTRSSNAAVRIEDVHGNVEIHASNARVRCLDTRGSLTVYTSNGKIEITGHQGALDGCTSNGLIQAALAEVGSGGVSLVTSNGHISLALPDPVDADVDVRVDNGIIRNHRSLCHCKRSSGGRLTGVLGRGGAPVNLRTSNGSISLK